MNLLFCISLALHKWFNGTVSFCYQQWKAKYYFSLKKTVFFFTYSIEFNVEYIYRLTQMSTAFTYFAFSCLSRTYNRVYMPFFISKCVCVCVLHWVTVEIFNSENSKCLLKIIIEVFSFQYVAANVWHQFCVLSKHTTLLSEMCVSGRFISKLSVGYIQQLYTHISCFRRNSVVVR